MGGIVKASFHRDRRCQIGFTSEYADTATERFGTTNRHMMTWSLPESPVCIAAVVIFLESDLTCFDGNDKDQMKWIPTPQKGQSVVVTIFVAEPPIVHWEGSRDQGNLIGVMETKTRATWATWNFQTPDAAFLKMVDDGRARAKQLPTDVELPLSHPGLRISLIATGSAGELILIDLDPAA